MTLDELLDGILAREGDAIQTNNPLDRGGRTRFGISERAHPDLWREGPPTREQARACYTAEYVAPFDALAAIDDVIVVMLIDDAVLSGVSTAIRRLQGVLQVRADGVLGPLTVQAFAARCQRNRVDVATALVVARVLGFARIVMDDVRQLPFLAGWLGRSLSFLPGRTNYGK